MTPQEHSLIAELYAKLGLKKNPFAYGANVALPLLEAAIDRQLKTEEKIRELEATILLLLEAQKLTKE